MQKVITYLRVSTKKQGLGIEAQRTIVENWARANNAEIVAEFSEQESGKKIDRPELQKAVAECKKMGATLVVAKLDRMSRSMLQLVQMFEEMSQSGVKFVVCTLPSLTPLTLGIFAGLAEQERRMISERTKQALAELKDRGVTLGSPKNLTIEARAKGVEAIKDNARMADVNRRAYAIASRMRTGGSTLQAIADELNGLNLPTRRGKAWTPTGIKNLINLYD